MHLPQKMASSQILSLQVHLDLQGGMLILLLTAFLVHLLHQILVHQFILIHQLFLAIYDTWPVLQVSKQWGQLPKCTQNTHHHHLQLAMLPGLYKSVKVVADCLQQLCYHMHHPLYFVSCFC